MIDPQKAFYHKTWFRSQQEARWAVFFDYLKIKWEYKPEWDEVDIGIGRLNYRPDFFLADQEMRVEVKPRDLD
jgi:hypothetical protein